MRPPRTLRLLLRMYPRAFRESGGRELLAFWEAQSTELRYRGLAGRMRLVAHLGLDALGGGLAMRWRRAFGTSVPRTRAGAHRHAGSIIADLRYSVRALLGAPTFCLMAVGTLALGIGAATAVFAALYGVALRPLPYPDANRLVQVSRTLSPGETKDSSWSDFRDWRQRAASYLALAATAETSGTFAWEGGAESLRGSLVTHDFFQVMGVAPMLGRIFSEDEDRMNGPDAVILSHALWQERFGGNANVIGRTVPLDDGLVPVVGVMPPGFSAPEAGLRYWAPLQEEELLARVGLPLGSRSVGFILVLGRLQPGVRLDTAQARLTSLAHQVAEDAGLPEDRRPNPALVPMIDDLVGGVRPMLFMLLSAAGLVLLVAAMNVAGLAFSRASAREHELALRSALGAPRSRLVRQLLVESGLLALAAGALGVLVARGLLTLLIQLAPSDTPRIETIGLDPATLGFATIATFASGLAFGLMPALLASRTSVSLGLSGGRRSSASRASLRPQQFLVSLQVAVSVVLLIGAVLLVTSFARLLNVDLGFQSDRVIVATINPSDAKYATPAEIDAFYSRLMEAVRQIPGVEAASTTNAPPLYGSEFRTTVIAEGAEEDRDHRLWAGSVVVRDDYFASNGVPLLGGRRFADSDRLGQPLVAIVNESMAARLWPGEDPIGKQFRLTGGVAGGAGSFDPAFFPREAYTVVGVAGDLRRTELDEPPAPEYYRPHAQLTWAYQYLVVRAAGPVSTVVSSLRNAVWSVDPTVPVRTVETLDERIESAAAEPRFRMVLVAGFAGLTGLLSTVGLYAVMALAVARRTREMSIRLALGASRSVVVRGVLASGLRLVVVGAAAGTVAAWFASRALSSLLFDVSPSDPVTYATVGGLTLIVAGLACYGPARRAGRVDPMQSLQAE